MLILARLQLVVPLELVSSSDQGRLLLLVALDP